MLYTFEKTPSYVSNPTIPLRMKKVVPWAKMVVVLRNPVDRAYSQYKMTVRDVYNLRNYTFEDFVFHEVKAMRDQFNMSTADPLLPDLVGSGSNGTTTTGTTTTDRVPEPPHHVPFGHAVLDPALWTPPHKALNTYTDRKHPLGHQVLLRRGLYAIQLQWWLKHYTLNENLLVINYADLAKNSQEVYERILTFCNIPVTVPTTNASASASANATADGINNNNNNATTPSFGRVRADLRAHDRPLKDTTRKYLQEFYAPYNAQLEQLLAPLSPDGEWSMERLGW